MVKPTGRLTARIGRTTDLAIDVALAGIGIVYTSEAWLTPHIASGALEAVLEAWWPRSLGRSSTIPDGGW